MPNEPLGITADDVAVSLAVREDLGASHEPAVIAEFLDRVGAAIDERVDARVAEQTPRQTPSRDFPLLPVISLGIGIPVTAIAANSEAGLGALVIAWAGIAAVNVADALRR
jgi:hypothetical protein